MTNALAILQLNLSTFTPYILFTLGQIVAFVVWIVSLQTKITKMESKIEQLATDKDELKKALSKAEEARKEENNWFREQLQKANEALAVAKSVMEGLALKSMKTYKA